MTLQLPITQVTVHPDGATVRRSGAASVTQGRVQITHLPLLLEPASVRVAVTGGTLQRTRLDLDLPYDHRAEEQAERAALSDKKAELGVLLAELESTAHVRELLVRGDPSIDTDGPAPTAALLGSWRDLAQAIDDWSARLDARSRELLRQTEALREAIEALEANLAERSSEEIWRRWAPTRMLELAVDGEAIEVEVSYTIPGARWTPGYGIDLTRDLGRGRFFMRALVAQATGEDWSGIALRLSTAPRRRIVDLPELTALRLGTVQPPRATGWRPLPADLDDLFPSDVPVTTGTAEVESASVWSDDDELEEPDVFMDDTPAPPMPAPAAAPAMQATGGAYGGVQRSMAMPSAPPQRRRSGAPRADVVPSGAPAASRKKKRAAPKGPPRYQAAADQLDYARLRVLGPQAGRRRRGRLEPQPEERLFSERGLPDQAWTRWSRAMRQLFEGTHLLRDRPMPPHHQVPGPVDDVDVAFELSGRVDVPSDGRFHAANVFTTEAEVELTYRAVPRSDTRVFRRVRAQVPRTGALPPGPLEASIEGSLEITAPFRGHAGDAAITFGLGAEDGLKLVRNVRYDEDSAGIFGGSRRFRTTIQVDIASSLGRQVRIELLERVPVPSKDGQPPFRVTDATPRAEPYAGEDQDRILKGGRRQLLDVAPGAEATAILTYEVELSNKEELAGGDRRG